VIPPREMDWNLVRQRAGDFPDAAYQFVREGLAFAARQLEPDPQTSAGSGAASGIPHVTEARQHISGQQLCFCLRELAHLHYGSLAGAVVRKWGVSSTADFGIIVYAMIDRGEMRAGPSDRFEDFTDVYPFDSAFALLPVHALAAN